MTHAFLPDQGSEALVAAYQATLTAHLTAATHNLVAPQSAPRFFDRVVRYSHLSPEAVKVLTAASAKKAQTLLEDINSLARELQEQDADTDHKAALRSGVRSSEIRCGGWRMRPVVRAMAWAFILLAAAFPGAAQEAEEREGGIIGTGIVGTVTELGSIHVNGQHIVFDQDLAVDDALGPVTAGDLRPGHTVAVIARPENDHWRAAYIRQVLPLVGPVESMDGKHMTVLGTDVRAKGRIEGVSVGDWVAVSGLCMATASSPLSCHGFPKGSGRPRSTARSSAGMRKVRS